LDYVRVASEAELADAARRDGAILLAGGTDLMVKMRAGSVRPRLLVDISRIGSLRHVSVAPDGAVIGSAARVADLLDSPALCARYPLLGLVLRSLGSVQIRSRATIGGNLANASPAADSAPALLAYDARLVVANGQGERTLPLDQFLLGPGRTALVRGEYIRAIVLPSPRPDWIPFFHKVGRRRALTIAIASVAGLLAIQGQDVVDVRLAAGSVAPTPLRLRRVEQLIANRRADPELARAAAEAAMQDVAPIDDVRATASYRREVVGELVARFLLAAVRPTSVSP
jgi:CO/xanthine dehydrogenase FAD-binding subunit